MITEIVYLDLAPGTRRDQVLATYRQSAPVWSKNEDLIYKYYFFDEAASLGGGVYIWKDKSAALRWHGDEYKARIREQYGCEPRISIFDTLIKIDNLNQEVTEPAQA